MVTTGEIEDTIYGLNKMLGNVKGKMGQSLASDSKKTVIKAKYILETILIDMNDEERKKRIAERRDTE